MTNHRNNRGRWSNDEVAHHAHAKVRSHPPDDQWVVVMPESYRPLADMSFVGFHVTELRRRLTARFGPGRLATTRTPGLLRWEPENRRYPCDS